FLNYYQLSEEKFSALFAVNASGLIVGNFLNGRLTKFYHYLTMAKYASILLFTLSLVIFSLFFFQENVSYTATVISLDRKSTRLNSSHVKISYAVFCLKKKKKPKYIISIKSY